MYSHGYLKVAACSPKCHLADPMYNAKQILDVLNGEAVKEKHPSIICFPEMSIPGYSIGDLVFQKYMYDDSLEAIQYLLDNVKYKGVFILGSFLTINDAIYNCAFVCQTSKILGIIPKSYLPHTNEFYESRWFASGTNISEELKEVEVLGQKVKFGKILFENGDVCFGTEICADMWAPVSPNEKLFANGALIIFNASASPSNIGKSIKRQMLTQAISLKMNGAYVYVSNNASESTSEVVFSGQKIIAYNGDILVNDDEITLSSKTIFADIDIDGLHNIRRNNGYFKSVQEVTRDMDIIHVHFDLERTNDYQFENEINKYPFVPSCESSYREIIDIQAASVVKRLNYIGIDKVVIGVSGGLDSTCALLSLVYAFDKYGIDRKNIIGVRLPSNSNSSNTYNNSKSLMEKLKITEKEINIMDAVNHQLKTIEHDTNTKDVTYENVQARYRTFCLMNLANLNKAIVIGTSDMSEVALGWSTFNGDQMAMYGINAGITKTVIRKTCEYYCQLFPEVSDEIRSVIDTPISPELAGSDQLTENIIGKYEINDFILYHFLVNGDNKKRIVFLLEKTFNLEKDKAINYVNNFYKRFYSQQYKRLTMPESAKILEICLSPRTEIRLNGDIYPPKDL